MKYFSIFIVFITFLVVSWSASSSLNLIFTENIQFKTYIPASITKSINDTKDNMIESAFQVIIDDFESPTEKTT